MEPRQSAGYRYLELIASIYVASLLIANTIAVKIVSIFGLHIPAGILCFPVTYIVNDVLTEVYGFKNARRIIFYGFLTLGFMVLMYAVSASLTPAPFWDHQEEYKQLFGFVPRIALGSLVAYYVGSLLNSYYMVVIKRVTSGRFLWMRTIGSTIVGEGADSIIFNTIAFAGLFGFANLFIIIVTGFALKTAYEVVATPFTYLVVARLKQSEGVE